MLQVMATTLMLATGWKDGPGKADDAVQDPGYAPGEDRADRLRRMRAAIDAFAPPVCRA